MMTLKNFLIVSITLFISFSCFNRENVELLVFDECPCDPAHKIENKEPIEGYSNRISYNPGDSLLLYVSSKEKKFEINIFDENLEGKEFLEIISTNGTTQDYNQCSFKYGCNWSCTERIVIPENTSGGYKTVRLSNSFGEFNFPIIIKSKSTNKILCVASTNTWQAYNDWGGASFYRYETGSMCDSKKKVFKIFKYPKTTRNWF